jgi:hypothetical protein
MSKLKIPGLSTTLIIDRDGYAIDVAVGSLEWDSDEVVCFLSAQLESSI